MIIHRNRMDVGESRLYSILLFISMYFSKKNSIDTIVYTIFNITLFFNMLNQYKKKYWEYNQKPTNVY